jgi:hypothetical protein
MLINKFTKIFTPADSLKHFYFPFVLERDFKKLEIKYSYAPKAFEDGEAAIAEVKSCYARYGYAVSDKAAEAELPLNNLITVSLDSPDGPCGGAHRHLSDAVYSVSETGASEGFLKTKIKAGKWTAVLSAHCILSPEVKASAEIYAYD